MLYQIFREQKKWFPALDITLRLPYLYPMTDAQQYNLIIEQLEELQDYLTSFEPDLLAMEGSAANYFVANVVYPAFHDQILLQAYRDEYFTYKNIVEGLAEEIQFFYTGIKHIENQPTDQWKRKTYTSG